MRRVIEDWIQVSHNGNIEEFKHDLQLLYTRDSQNGQNPFQFRNDMEAINKELTGRDLLPNMHIFGIVDGQVVVKEEKRINQYGVLATDGHLATIKDVDIDWQKGSIKIQTDEAPKSIGAVSPEGVKQGSAVGDCRFEAWLSSFANANPDAVQKMIKDNGDGTFTVTFPGDKDHPQTVSTPTPWEHDTFAPGAGEWSSILGKAYRQRENLPFGPGTESAKDFEGLMTGKANGSIFVWPDCGTLDWVDKNFFGTSTCPDNRDKTLARIIEGSSISSVEVSQLGARIEEALLHHMIISTSFDKEKLNGATARDSEGNTVSLEGAHSYSVLGYDSKTQTITLRNPWGGNFESASGRMVGNGIVTLSLAEFQKLMTALQLESTS